MGMLMTIGAASAKGETLSLIEIKDQLVGNTFADRGSALFFK